MFLLRPTLQYGQLRAHFLRILKRRIRKSKGRLVKRIPGGVQRYLLLRGACFLFNIFAIFDIVRPFFEIEPF